MLPRAALVLLALLLLPLPAAAQQSRCADCHFANPSAPAADHLTNWDHSPHGREQVGCEKCHGGNPDTFESVQAHQGILASTNPASPVARQNLPRTCGSCHTGPFVAFQKSRHFEMLNAGNPDAPACATCHGDVGAHLPSPRSLEARCDSCHAAGKSSPHPEFASQGRLFLEGIREVRDKLDDAESLIRHIDEPQRRADLEYQYQQAQVPLIEAANAGHSFVFENLEERLQVARERTDKLMNALANP